VDWFFGFKLHLVVNEEGELLNVHLTPGNVDDRKPVNKLLQSLVKPDSFIDVISRKIS
jgi:transposase